MNGKTQSYEAVVLIPFVSETEILVHEERLLKEGVLVYTDGEVDRNTSTFGFNSIKYKRPAKNSKPSSNFLKSSLNKFTGAFEDHSSVTFNKEYENIGKLSFEPKMLNGVIEPQPGFPSFKFLNV